MSRGVGGLSDPMVSLTGWVQSEIAVRPMLLNTYEPELFRSDALRHLFRDIR